MLIDLPFPYSRIGLKIRTRESGDSGTPLQTEAAIRPRERLSLINAAIERDLTRRKERDHGYEDILEVSLIDPFCGHSDELCSRTRTNVRQPPTPGDIGKPSLLWRDHLLR